MNERNTSGLTRPVTLAGTRGQPTHLVRMWACDHGVFSTPCTATIHRDGYSYPCPCGPLFQEARTEWRSEVDQ